MKKKLRAPISSPTPSPPAEDAGRSAFPIVGIGASAGGLEALERFLQNLPVDSGMAIVIVQHLDPTHKGPLVEQSEEALQQETKRKAGTK